MGKAYSSKYMLVIQVVWLLLLIMIVPGSVMAVGSLSIEPLRQELELQPGQAFTSTLKVRNNTDRPAKVTLSAQSFTVTNEAYDYEFKDANDLAQWVQFKEKTVELAANQGHDFVYTVGAPLTISPGGKYIVIFATYEGLTNNDAPLTTIERAGQLLYITVPGNLTRQGKLRDRYLPRFVFERTYRFSARLHNPGSVHFKSTVAADFDPLHGDNSKINAEHLVMPSSVRYIEQSSDLGFWPNIIKADILLGLGDNPAHKQTITIFYLPSFFVWLVVVSIGIVGLLYARRRRT
jgi:hypothetical protein